jgi:hypothetical protein
MDTLDMVGLKHVPLSSFAFENIAVNSNIGWLLDHNSLKCNFLWKVSFNMSKLDLKFLPKDHDLSVNNEIGGISLKFMKLQPQNGFGEAATHLRLETDVTEIHVCFNNFYRS